MSRKRKKNRSPRSVTQPQIFPKKPASRWLGVAVAVAMLLGTVLVFVFLPRKAAVVDAESVIVSKLTQQPNKSMFAPLLLYQYYGGDSGKFIGSGVGFTGSHGQQVVTAEHVCREEMGGVTIGYRTLRPLETDVRHGISSVLYTGGSFARSPGEMPDIMIFAAGDPKPAICTSHQTLTPFTVEGTVSRVDGETKITSLVSGEQVRIVGLTKSSSDGGVEYFLIEYSSIGGESGTGFVDKDDGLYILKAAITWDEKKRQKVAELLGTQKELSLVYGPLKFNRQ